jgi:hypothetical protein
MLHCASSTRLNADVQGVKSHETGADMVNGRWSIACRCRRLGDRRAGTRQGPVFIEGSRPVTEEQVRQKLVSDGWTNIQVVRRGRLVMAMGSKDGRTDAFAVDAFTGRLRSDGDDDDDD